jgi:hypothetical protein
MAFTVWRQRVAGGSTIAAEAYTAALNWKNNSEVSNLLTKLMSNQHSTPSSKAIDYEYLRTHIGGGWHRLYDGGHSLVGSWKAVSSSLPDLGTLQQLGIWANEYWKDLITTRGMPIFILDHAQHVSEYFKHLDCVNVAQLTGGDICGVSIYCNWNDPAKLVGSATATECSGLVYANVVAPLVSLIALGRGGHKNLTVREATDREKRWNRIGFFAFKTAALAILIPGTILSDCGVTVGCAAWDYLKRKYESRRIVR